jgi:hypothetical protein
VPRRARFLRHAGEPPGKREAEGDEESDGEDLAALASSDARAVTVPLFAVKALGILAPGRREVDVIGHARAL